MNPITLEVKSISCQVPQGLQIRKCSHGYGLFATKSFKAGEKLYKGSYEIVEDTEEEYLLETDQGEFTLSAKTHAVWIGQGARALYAFDSFMNHSCDSNSCSKRSGFFLEEKEYWQIATKDIFPGDEVTCDYALFDYECDGHPISQCQCGSEKCRGLILGFKHLPLDEQIKWLGHEDNRLLQPFLEDHPEIVCVEDLRIPKHVEIAKEGSEYKVVAKKRYKPGDLIFENTTHNFPRNLLIMVRLNDTFVLLDNDRHMVNRGDSEQEFFYFDTFMNHSCDPNASTLYVSSNRYQTRALKPIAAGDELTCDYETFSMGIGFTCRCGSSKCRGMVYQNSPG